VKARIFEGDYSPDDLARFLLWASGNYREAKKALTRASNEKPTPIPDDMVYLAAYHLYKKKKRCRDSTALKKLLGPSKYRAFWNKLQARDQTLEQIARLYPTRDDESALMVAPKLRLRDLV
jgi:hypothetical protein